MYSSSTQLIFASVTAFFSGTLLVTAFFSGTLLKSV